MTAVKRTLPMMDMDSRFFWTGGENGTLMLFRCGECEYYIHPPVRFCPECESRRVEPQAVSGRATVLCFTINYREWIPGLDTPYVLALVEPVEQPGIRLVTNIVNCDVDAVAIGMPVKVLFEQAEDIWIPLFEPDSERC